MENEGKKKAKIGSFGISNGARRVEMNADEMPEDVRAYLLELGDQLRGEGGNALNLAEDMLPENVQKFFAGQIDKHRERLMEKKLGDFDPDMLVEFVNRKMPETVEALGVSDVFGIRMAMHLLTAMWVMIVEEDDDWKALDIETALRLWFGVEIAMYGAVKSAGEEMDGDEEESD